MGVSNYIPTGISHATSVDFSKRSVNQPVHIVQYDRTLPILAVSLYNNGQLYRLSETMEVSIRLGKPDRTFVYNKALGCDSTRTIVYFEITQQMSLFDGEFYPVIEIVDGEKIANSSTIYLVVDRNPVQHDYIESTIEYKELIDYRDEAVNAGNEAKEAAKIAKDSVQTVVDKTKEAVEASETAVNASNSASASAESILGVEENVTRIGNMVSEKEPIIAAAAETAIASATNAEQSETNAKASEEASKLSETNAKDSENKAKASEEASKLSETNAKDSENESVKYGNLAKSYAVGTDNTIRENDAEDNAKTYCEAAKTSAGNAKQSETNAKTYLDKIIEKVDVTVDTEMSDTSENPVQNKVIKKYVDEHTPEVSDMTGATSTQNGAHGLVPAPQMGDEKKALLGDGTWGSVDAILTFKTKEEYDAAVANDEIPDGAKVIKEYDEGDSTVIIGVDTVMSDTSVNPVQNKVIKKYVDEHTPEVAGMTGATAEANGTSGTVPAPLQGQEEYVLKGNGNWEENVKTDTEFSTESTNPIANSTTTAKFNEVDTTLNSLYAYINHNIPRLVPKDITSYYQDGSLWDRLNGTNGYSFCEDIFAGDYFKMSRAISAYNQDHTYQLTGSEYVTIAEINGLWGNGDIISISYNHLVMIPGSGFGGTQHFGRSRMNPTHTTEGGYVASEMHTTTLGPVTTSGSIETTATINQQLYAEFGSHLKTTKELLFNSLNATGINRFGVATGCANNWAWYDCQAVLMSEVEVYGSIVWSASGFDVGNANKQFALFANSKMAINDRSAWYWLKGIASASDFCVCDYLGYSNYFGAASASGFVRPRFVIAA